MAYFDVDKLDKIIYNLLSNALKYNYQDGMVSISLSQVVQNDRRYFMLKVENTEMEFRKVNYRYYSNVFMKEIIVNLKRKGQESDFH